ncbi:MAG: hypothetical protein CSA81_09865 [Acidobacteria bacterium]|nr:MAG: hypothetical protein CSA81_09865 [Acidobacteriota bacterium]
MKAVDCPNLTLDNSDFENKVRSFVLGRKNWLMANTPDSLRPDQREKIKGHGCLIAETRTTMTL